MRGILANMLKSYVLGSLTQSIRQRKYVFIPGLCRIEGVFLCRGKSICVHSQIGLPRRVFRSSMRQMFEDF